VAKKKHKMAKKRLQHTCTVGRIGVERANSGTGRGKSNKLGMEIELKLQ